VIGEDFLYVFKSVPLRGPPAADRPSGRACGLCGPTWPEPLGRLPKRDTTEAEERIIPDWPSSTLRESPSRSGVEAEPVAVDKVELCPIGND
jgi:hypothetical protein